MLSTLAKAGAARSLLLHNAKFGLRCASGAAGEKKEFKKVPVSQSFAMNLFAGRINTEQVFPYPLALDAEAKETLAMIISPTEKFLTEVNDVAKNDENAAIPMETLKQFGELGAFGAVVPVEYEGAGLINSQMARLAEIVGAHDLGLGVVMGAHQSIGYKGILLYGSDAQKAKYLPDLATGRKFAAFCLTESTAGSDANSIRSEAVKSADGKHYILNGGKIFISNGGFADVMTVFAQTPVKQADGSIKKKVSAFVVERSFGGVTSGPPEKKMGIKGSNTTEVHFDNVKIPAENLLGEEGEGFKVAVNILNNGRFGIPAACTGSMRHCIQKTIDHVTSRVQFGKKIEEYGNVQEKLANMIARLYANESILYLLAANMDAGVKDYQLEAAMAKVFTSENAWWTCDEAIQLHGGMGFMRETGLELVLRDLRIFRIFEGANDVMRLFVSLTGCQYAGKQFQQLASDIKAGGVGTLFGEIKRRFGASSSGVFGSQVDPSLKDSAALLDTCAGLFGKTVEALLLKHKKGIIDRQFELTRVADAAIDIYAMAATLSRCSKTAAAGGGAGAEYEKKVANLFVQQASERALANLKEAAAGNDARISLIGQVAREACKNGANPVPHPIDVL